MLNLSTLTEAERTALLLARKAKLELASGKVRGALAALQGAAHDGLDALQLAHKALFEAHDALADLIDPLLED